MAVQPDGKIVAGGWSLIADDEESWYAYNLVRYNADGSPDSTFGTGGVTQVMLGDGQNPIGGSSLTIAGDGKIIFAGYGTPGSGGQDMVVIRVNSDGSLDSGTTGDADALDSFGTGGIATVDFSGGAE